LILPVGAVLEESVSKLRAKSPSFSDFQELAAALSYAISSNMSSAMCVAIKFLACIALLIFARGGIPRFRFDYLTKLGWIRFLSLVLLIFLLEILIVNTF
jgi:NADH:ubiquinone oxidoreductase subunit H